MLQIAGPMTSVIEWKRTNVLYFFFVFVIAIDESFVVRIDDVPVSGIRHDKPAFTAASLKPIVSANYSFVRATRNADIRIVLLRAINVIRKCVIYSYVIKLRRRLIVLSRPVFPAIRRDACAAIAHIGDSVRVCWIDPKSVMISMPCRHEVECLSAINGFEETGV